MSNIGLNSNIFHSFRGYLDMLNHYIVDANYARIKGEKYNDHRVTDFFTALNNQKIIDPNLRLIRSIIQSHYRLQGKEPNQSILEIAKKVENSENDVNIMTELEDLLNVLREQYNESYARIKGED